MAKLPSFQFYPGDWMKDPALRASSIGARGLWTDMLCLMFESSRRGYLQHATGKPVTAEQLARMTGCSTDEVSRLLQELEDSGVFSRTEHGVIYSRRMARDEGKRVKCVEAGKRGGNPTLKGPPKGDPKGGAKGDPKGDANRNPTPSSSSSSSTSVSPPPPVGAGEAEEEAVAPPDTVGPNPTRVVGCWNAQPGLMPATPADMNRDRLIRTWATTNALWVKHWEAAIAFMGRTPHYCGGTDLQWRAALSWLFEKSNFAKVVERMQAESRPAATLPFKPVIKRATDVPFVLPSSEEPNARAS